MTERHAKILYCLTFLLLLTILFQPLPIARAQEEETPRCAKKFRGIVTEANFGCSYDASCDLTLNGKIHVHFGHDTRGDLNPRPWGSRDILWEKKDDIVGKTVEVYAETDTNCSAPEVTEGWFTIQGSSDYYIKLAKP